MPFRDEQTHLRDILEAIVLIESFVGDMELSTYREDLKTKSAVERQIQILSEATKRLGEASGPKYIGPDWRSYCNMGNIIRHAYHRVDDELIWNTLKHDLPQLKRSLQQTLEDWPKS